MNRKSTTNFGRVAAKFNFVVEMKKGNNNISTVSGDAFVGLQRIKFLNLEGNSIKAIGGNTLAHLSGCIILDLRNDSYLNTTYLNTTLPT